MKAYEYNQQLLSYVETNKQQPLGQTKGPCCEGARASAAKEIWCAGRGIGHWDGWSVVGGGREGGQSESSDEGDREGAVGGLMGRVGEYGALE